MAELLSLEEAQKRILDRVTPLTPEVVLLAEAAGRVVFEDALAVVDLPPFASSAMDGFAVRSEDTPGRLPVVARIAAGVPAPRALEQGEAMAIATGGVVPAGADSVIPIEYVVDNDNEVEIPNTVVHGDNVRPRGGDVAAGDVVVPSGARLGAAQIGALAAAGLDHVVVARRPTISMLATGTELRRPGELLEPGQIYEANGVLLATAFTTAGADVEVLPVVTDDEASHRQALERGPSGCPEIRSRRSSERRSSYDRRCSRSKARRFLVRSSSRAGLQPPFDVTASVTSLFALVQLLPRAASCSTRCGVRSHT